MKKIITLVDKFIYPRTRDGSDYSFTFSIIDPDSNKSNRDKENLHIIKVGISGTMEALWKIRQENINIEKACFEYGKREILSRLKNQILLDKQELEILTNTHPNECPFDTNKIDYRIGASGNFE